MTTTTTAKKVDFSHGTCIRTNTEIKKKNMRKCSSYSFANRVTVSEHIRLEFHGLRYVHEISRCGRKGLEIHFFFFTSSSFFASANSSHLSCVQLTRNDINLVEFFALNQLFSYYCCERTARLGMHLNNEIYEAKNSRSVNSSRSRFEFSLFFFFFLDNFVH